MDIEMNKIILTLLLLIVLSCCFLLISLSDGDIEDVVVCSTGSGSHYIPTAVCKYYLYNFRADANDIQYLQNRSGLNFIINMADVKDKNKLLSFFLSKGLDINKQSNIDGFPPLHAAILLNDVKSVSFLLKNGVSLTTVDKKRNLTPLEFSMLLKENNPKVDRSAVMALLKG